MNVDLSSTRCRACVPGALAALGLAAARGRCRAGRRCPAWRPAAAPESPPRPRPRVSSSPAPSRRSRRPTRPAPASTRSRARHHQGDFERAARYLTLDSEAQARGPELARRLRAVLERHLDVDFDALSPLGEGATDDGLPPGVDKLGEVPDGRGGHDPVFLVRALDERGRLLGLLPADRLPHRRLVRRAARPLGPRPHPGAAAALRAVDLLWWQWLALPLLVDRRARARARARRRLAPGAVPPHPAHRDPLGRAAAASGSRPPSRSCGPSRSRRCSCPGWRCCRGRSASPAQLLGGHRDRRRLLGAVALGGRVGELPVVAAGGGGERLGALAGRPAAQLRQGVRGPDRHPRHARGLRLPRHHRPRRPRHRRRRARLRGAEDGREPVRLGGAGGGPAVPARRLREDRGLRRATSRGSACARPRSAPSTARWSRSRTACWPTCGSRTTPRATGSGSAARSASSTAPPRPRSSASWPAWSRRCAPTR